MPRVSMRACASSFPLQHACVYRAASSRGARGGEVELRLAYMEVEVRRGTFSMSRSSAFPLGGFSGCRWLSSAKSSSRSRAPLRLRSNLFIHA